MVGFFSMKEGKKEEEERNEKEQSETSIQIESSIVIIVTLDDDFRCSNYSLSFSFYTNNCVHEQGKKYKNGMQTSSKE